MDVIVRIFCGFVFIHTVTLALERHMMFVTGGVLR